MVLLGAKWEEKKDRVGLFRKKVGQSQNHGSHFWADALFPTFRGGGLRQKQERLEPEDAGSRIVVGGIQRRWGAP
jgi:hypothetical protein